MSDLLYERKDSVGIITINRPKLFNALNSAVLKELYHLLDDIENDKAIRAVIITGSGEKSFVAGADIKEMAEMSSLEARCFSEVGKKTMEKIEGLTKPVIAAINGFALGGGCELALACDIRIASKNAMFALPEVNLGVIPGFGGTQRCSRLIGSSNSKLLMFTGEQINAEEAFKLGLINNVVDSEQLMNTVLDLARKISKKSSVAINLIKRSINTGDGMDLNASLNYETELFGISFSTFDQREGMNAFIEKRRPNFGGK